MKQQHIYNGASVQHGSNRSTPFSDGGVNAANAKGMQQAAANLAGLGEQMLKMEDFSQEQKDEATLTTEAQNFDSEVERRLALPDGHSDSFHNSDGTLRQNKVTSLVDNYRKKFEPLGSEILDPERRMRMQARAQHTINSMGGALLSRGAKEMKRKALINYQNNRDLALQRGDYASVLDMDSRAVGAALIPQSQADLQAYELQQAEYTTTAQNAWNQSPAELARLWDEGHFDEASADVQGNVQRMLQRAGGLEIPQTQMRRVANKDGSERVEKLPPEAPRGLPSYLVRSWNENGGNFSSPDAKAASAPLLANWAKSQITSPNNPEEKERVEVVMKAFGASDEYASSIISMLQKDLGGGRVFDPSSTWDMMHEDAFFSEDNQAMIQGWRDEYAEKSKNKITNKYRLAEIEANLEQWDGFREEEKTRAKAIINGKFDAWRASNPNASYKDQFSKYWDFTDQYIEEERGEPVDHTALGAYQAGEAVALHSEEYYQNASRESENAKRDNDEDVAATEALRDLEDQQRADAAEISEGVRSLPVAPPSVFNISTERGASNGFEGNDTEAILYVPKGSGIAQGQILMRAEGDIASYARVIETDKVTAPTMSRRLRGNLGDYTGKNKSIQIQGNQAILSNQRQTSNMNNMQQLIVDSEARRDKQGRIRVYKLPAGDGGGSYEVAGINDKYHPKQAARLKSLVESGQHEQAEEEAAAYITEYTQPVQDLLSSAGVQNEGVEYYLRDIYFNGGQGGAAKVLNRALGVKGSKFTDSTREALSAYVAKNGDTGLLELLRDTRVAWYKGIASHNPEKRKFLKGWINRTNETYSNAQSLA